MSKLNPIEQECQDLIAIMIDRMAAGTSMHHYEHMELLGRLRMAGMHLLNKEYGCLSGKHSGPCACK